MRTIFRQILFAGDPAHGRPKQHLHRSQPKARRQLPAGRKSCFLKYGNRHGLITGATGTGKTVSLQILAEGFSNAGVPVFAADVKGDLSGIAAMGEAKDFLVKRAEQIKLDPYEFQEFPVIFWDLFGEKGHPDPRHRFRDGPAAALAPDEPHRSAGRHHEHRLQDRRRRGAVCFST